MSEREGKEGGAAGRRQGPPRERSGRRKQAGRQPQCDLGLTRFLMPRLEGAGCGGGGETEVGRENGGKRGVKRNRMIMFAVTRSLLFFKSKSCKMMI